MYIDSMYKKAFLTFQAAKRNLVYPHYAFIMHAVYPDQWWTMEKSGGRYLEGCSDEMLEEFLIKSRAFMIHIFPETDNISAMTDSGIVRNFCNNYVHYYYVHCK